MGRGQSSSIAFCMSLAASAPCAAAPSLCCRWFISAPTGKCSWIFFWRGHRCHGSLERLGYVDTLSLSEHPPPHGRGAMCWHHHSLYHPRSPRNTRHSNYIDLSLLSGLRSDQHFSNQPIKRRQPKRARARGLTFESTWRNKRQRVSAAQR